MKSLVTFTKQVGTGQQARLVRAAPDEEPACVAAALELAPPTGLLVLSGGAGGMSTKIMEKLVPLFATIGQSLAQQQATVIDGGTNAGVMKLMGQTLAQTPHAGPQIGVLPARAKSYPEELVGEEILEPHHSHFVLVDSQRWGEEVKLMYALAAYLAAEVPSVALLVNGGQIALEEIRLNGEQRREVIVIGGSGRLADEIAGAIRRPEKSVRPAVAALIRGGHFTVFELADDPWRLGRLLRERLEVERP